MSLVTFAYTFFSLIAFSRGLYLWVGGRLLRAWQRELAGGCEGAWGGRTECVPRRVCDGVHGYSSPCGGQVHGSPGRGDGVQVVDISGITDISPIRQHNLVRQLLFVVLLSCTLSNLAISLSDLSCLMRFV